MTKKVKETAIEEVINCPIYKTMEIFQGKWNTWVLFELGRKGPLRFGELQKTIPGVSKTVLSKTLKDLEHWDLIKRTQYNEIPPHVEYAATKKAQDLNDVFEAMWSWGAKYAD